MNNQVFSWRRFGLALKAFLVEGKSQLALCMGVIWGIMIFSAVKFAQQSLTYMGSFPERAIAAEEGMVFFAIYSFAAVLMGSWMFGTLATKPKRISTLMLPASSLEKFLVRWCVYVVLYTLAFVVGIFVADGIRALCTPADALYCSLWSFVKTFGYDVQVVDQRTPMITYWLAFLFFALIGQALYALGSVTWPKNSFIKTFVALFVIFFVLLFIGPAWWPALLQNLTVGGVIALELTFIVLLYVAVYFLFSRVQVSQKFM